MWALGGRRNPGQNSLGPDSPNPVTQQAIITAQYGFDVTSFDTLKKNEGPLFMGRVIEEGDVIVSADEPFFVERGGVHAGSVITAFSGVGKTSFNGISIRGLVTDDDLWDRYVYVGHTHGSTYAKNVVTNSGVAVGVHGSHSYPRNYGPDNFSPGDRITLELPSIDPKKRQMQLAMRPHVEGVSRTKLIATPRRFDPADLYRAYSAAAAELIEKHDSGLFSIQAFRHAAISAKRTKMSRRQETAAWRKQDLALSWYSAVMTLYHLGYIKPSYDATIQTPSFNSTHNTQIVTQLSKIHPIKWWETNVDEDINEKLEVTPADATVQKQNRKASNDFARFMAARLGLATSPQQPWLKEDMLLVKQLLVRQLGTASSVYTYASAARNMVREDFNPARKVATGVLGSNTYQLSISDQVMAIAADASSTHMRAVGRELDNLYARLAGTATNRSHSGGVLHVAA